MRSFWECPLLSERFSHCCNIADWKTHAIISWAVWTGVWKWLGNMLMKECCPTSIPVKDDDNLRCYSSTWWSIFIHGNQSVCNLSKYIYCSSSWEKCFVILFLYSISSRCICNGERKTFRTVFFFLYICCVLWTRYKSSQVWARLTFMTASSPIQLNNFQD